MRLFPACALLIDRDPENVGLYVWHRKPYVVLVSARDQGVINPTDLRAIGYCFVSHEIGFPGAYYARPWALWALLKTTNATRIAWWRGVWSLYRRGIFHLTGGEGTDFRWRDVRPGPDRSAPLAALTREDIEQEMTKIQEEHYSADPANMLRVSRRVAEDSSLDERTRELARIAIEELEKLLENVGPNG